MIRLHPIIKMMLPIKAAITKMPRLLPLLIKGKVAGVITFNVAEVSWMFFCFNFARFNPCNTSKYDSSVMRISRSFLFIWVPIGEYVLYCSANSFFLLLRMSNSAFAFVFRITSVNHWLTIVSMAIPSFEYLYSFILLESFSISFSVSFIFSLYCNNWGLLSCALLLLNVSISVIFPLIVDIRSKASINSVFVLNNLVRVSICFSNWAISLDELSYSRKDASYRSS